MTAQRFNPEEARRLENDMHEAHENNLVAELRSAISHYGEDVGPWLCALTRLDEITRLLQDLKRLTRMR